MLNALETPLPLEALVLVDGKLSESRGRFLRFGDTIHVKHVGFGQLRNERPYNFITRDGRTLGHVTRNNTGEIPKCVVLKHVDTGEIVGDRNAIY